MPATAREPSGRFVDVLCGQPEQNHGVRSVVLKGRRGRRRSRLQQSRTLEVDLAAQRHGAEETLVAGLAAAAEAAARAGGADRTTSPAAEPDVSPNMPPAWQPFHEGGPLRHSSTPRQLNSPIGSTARMPRTCSGKCVDRGELNVNQIGRMKSRGDLE